MNLSTRDLGLLAVGGALVVALAYYAYNSTDDQVTPAVQTEAQFEGLGIDVSTGLNVGTNLSLDPHLHFYHPGFDPEPGAQKVITSAHRYPVVAGGNVSTIIHRGFDAMRQASPDNRWRIDPPSEDNL